MEINVNPLLKRLKVSKAPVETTWITGKSAESVD
jgi:hypothetical protein